MAVLHPPGCVGRASRRTDRSEASPRVAVQREISRAHPGGARAVSASRKWSRRCRRVAPRARRRSASASDAASRTKMHAAHDRSAARSAESCRPTAGAWMRATRSPVPRHGAPPPPGLPDGALSRRPRVEGQRATRSAGGASAHRSAGCASAFSRGHTAERSPPGTRSPPACRFGDRRAAPTAPRPLGQGRTRRP